MSVELKIKYKSLAAESRFIKDEERKSRNQARKLNVSRKTRKNGKQITKAEQQEIRSGISDEQLEARKAKAARFTSDYAKLKSHRVEVVRVEARKTHLARAFLKGVPYSVVERKVHDNNRLNEYGTPKVEDVYKLASRYSDSGDNELRSNFEAWIKS